MKKIILGALAAIFAAHSFAADLPKVTFLTDPGFVPFEWQDPASKEYLGFDVDLIKAIGEKAGFTPVIKPMEFDGIIPALQTKTADGAIAGMTITDARAKVVDFSAPYYDSGLELLVAANNTDIKTIADLSGKSVATKTGSTGYDFMEKNKPEGAKNITYPNTSDMYVALLGGNVQAVFHDAPNVAYFAKTKGQGKVKVLPTLYEGQQYGIAFAKGDKWLAPTNKALAELKADGTYQKIYDKYFGK